MIALLEAKAAGLWSRKHIANNLLAGIVVGIVALPLAMAFAIASGARPEQGIYTAIVAALMTSLFGGTRVQISGPTGAFVAVLAIITAQHGIAGLQIATLMAGMILLAFGVARLGAVIKYIPNPVIAGFTAGIGVIIFVGRLAPVASVIPLCCLSAILFVVAWNMSEVRHFLRIIRGAPRPDVAVLLLTFLLTVFVDLVVAVNVGVILAALLFMRRMSDAVSIEPHTRAPESEINAGASAGGAGVVIYSIEGPFFFGAAEKFERSLQHVQRRTTTLVLRLGNVPFVDATGIFALEEILADFKRNGAAVLLTEVRPNVLYKLERGGLIDLIGKENVFESLSDALARAEQSRTAAR